MGDNNGLLPKIYLGVFFIFWAVLAINPNDRYMWAVENALLGVFLLILIVSYRKFKFSNTSYTLIFLFSILQTVGAHYTYSEVPFSLITNFFGFSRNHFDRLVHFSFGLLFAYPFREFMMRTSGVRSRFWSYYFPVEMAFATGAVYEVIEWLFAIGSDPAAGSAFLGSQGDIWDAQADMFLAGLGASVAMLIAFGFWFFSKKDKNKRRKR